MPEVRYQFVAADQGSVVAAFHTIGQAAHASARDMEKTRVEGRNAMRAVAQEATRAGGQVNAALSQSFDRAGSSMEKALVRASKRLAQLAKQLGLVGGQVGQLNQNLGRMPGPRGGAGGGGRGGTMSFARSFARSAGRRILFSAGNAALDLGTRAIRENIALEDQAARIATKGRKVGEAGESPREIARELQRTATEVPGSKASDIGSAIEAFIAKTGEGKVGRGFRKTFAQLSLAEGVRGEDLGSTAADIYAKTDAKTPEAIQSILERLTLQGKSGAFEMTDMASQMPKMLAAAGRSNAQMTGENIAQLGGIAQMSKANTGGGPAAATAVAGMFTELIKKAGPKGIGGYGVHVFENKNGVKQMRDFTDVLPELIKATKGDAEKLQKIFPGGKGGAYSAVAELVKIFQKVRLEGGSLDDAFKAVRDALKQTVDAGTAHAEVMKDLATMQDTTGAKLDAAWESIKSQLMDDAGPAIIDAIKTVADALRGADFKPLFKALAFLAETAIGAGEALGLIAHKDLVESEAEAYGQNKEKLDALGKEREGLMGKVGSFSATPAERERIDAIDKEMAELRTKVQGSKGFADIKEIRDKFIQDFASGGVSEVSARGGGIETGRGNLQTPEQFKDYAENLWDSISSGALNKEGAPLAAAGGDANLAAIIQAAVDKMNPGKANKDDEGATKLVGAGDKLSSAADAISAAAKEMEDQAKNQQSNSVFSGLF